jgi:Uma2 family endonuclease
MPDVVIEIASPTDAWVEVKRKVDKHERDGATYAIAIDPKTHDVYARGRCPNDLVLDLEAISEA